MTTYVDHPSSRAGSHPRPLRVREAPPCRDLRTRPLGARRFGPISAGSTRTGPGRPREDVGALSARVDALVELTSRAIEELAKAYSLPTSEPSGRERSHASVEGGAANGPEQSESGALAHLRSLPDGSLGAVFSPELADGLGPGEFGPFVAEAFRVLRPGGMLVAENRSTGWDPVEVHHIGLGPVEVHHIGLGDQVLPEAAVLLCRQAGFLEATAVFHEGRSDRCSDVSWCADYAVVAVR